MSAIKSIFWVRRGATCFLMTIAFFILAACGGGGSSSAGNDSAATSSSSSSSSSGGIDDRFVRSVSDAEGVWKGFGLRQSQYGVTIVMNDGTYYHIYSSTTQPVVIQNMDPFVPETIDGFLQGKLSSAWQSGFIANTTSFLSSDARDFHFGGSKVTAPTLNGDVMPSKSMSMKVQDLSGKPGLGFYYVSGFLTNDYSSPALLSSVAGNYGGQVGTASAGRTDIQFTISSTGSVTGNFGACSFTGQITPHGEVHYYDFSASFQGSACAMVNAAYHGVGYYDAKYQRLYVAMPNSARDDGFGVLGIKK